MKSRFRMLLAAITFFAGLALLFAALALPLRLAAQDKQDHNRRHHHYHVIDIGTLGGTFSQAGGLNNRGSVAGFSSPAGDQVLHAFLWQRGVFTDLGTLGGPNSATFEAPVVNDRGAVSGFSDTSTPDPNGEDVCGDGNNLICLPFVWQRGVMTALPLLGGNNGQALQINNRGQIVGLAENTTPDPTCAGLPLFLHFEAVIWENGQIQELPPFPGDPDAIAIGINDKGQVVGASGPCIMFFGGGFHALLWQDGTAIDLGNLGGTFFNLAFGINNQGQVVGQSGLPGNTTFHAFLWQDGVMTDLGTLPGLPVSLANGINNQGQVVGFSQDMNGNNRVAFLWQDGVLTDLNTLIPAGSPLFLLEALGINNGGQIAGYALEIATGQIHGFLATPCGEGDESCEGENPTGERPTVVLPENVRKFLQQRRGFGRFGLGR